jgi:dihydrofolate reductase
MKVILAVSPDWGIADLEGNLLYHNSDDMRLFKGLTYGCSVIAGYRTAMTLEGGLRGRNCLVDSTASIIGWDTLKGCRPQNAWIIGGAKTITKRLPTITEFWLSVFNEKPNKEVGVKLCDQTVSLLSGCEKITVAKFNEFKLVRYLVK